MDYIAAMRHEDQLAKRHFYIILALNLFLVIIAISAIFVRINLWLTLFGALVLLARVFSFFTSIEQQTHEKYSAILRRFALVKDGLGIEPKEKDLISIEAKLNTNNVVTGMQQQYYDSKLPRGEKRLAIIIAESALFTGELSRIMAKYFARLSIVGIVIIIIVLYLLLCNGIKLETQPSIAKSFVSLALFFTLGDFALLWKKYQGMADTCENVMKEGIEISKAYIENNESLILLERYLCTLSNGPLIPTWVYNKNRERLNKLWAKRGL